MDLPEIALLVITFDRYNELKETLSALMENIQYPADKLHIIVSDDSTGGTKLNNLGRIKAYKEWGADGIDIIETPSRSGWGKHVNWALGKIQELYPQTQYVFQIEDDYVLKAPLDLTEGVAIMETRPNIGMLRYRGTAGMRYIYHQFETDINPYLDWRGAVSYLQLDNASPSLYVYSNGAHLKRLQPKDGYADFHSFYGAYDEGLKLGETEEKYAHRVKDKMREGNAPAIAILPDWVNMRFDHIGETFQGTANDI